MGGLLLPTVNKMLAHLLTSNQWERDIYMKRVVLVDYYIIAPPPSEKEFVFSGHQSYLHIQVFYPEFDSISSLQ